MDINSLKSNNMKFSKILSKLMKDMNISAKALSAKTGIPRTTISEWLGDRSPTLGSDIIKLSEFFNVSLDYMLTGKNNANSNNLDHEAKRILIHEGLLKVTIERLRPFDTDE